jgi:hypothetical protein
MSDPDVGPDLDAWLGPWPWSGPVAVRAAGVADQDGLGIAIDLMRRNLDAVRRAVDLLDRGLSRLQSKLQSTKVRPATVANAAEAPRSAPPAGAEVEAPAERPGSEPAPQEPGGSEAGTGSPLLIGGVTVSAPLQRLGLEPAPLNSWGVRTAAGALPVRRLPPAQLVEFFLQASAIAFLAAVLLVPVGCWIAAGRVGSAA